MNKYLFSLVGLALLTVSGCGSRVVSIQKTAEYALFGAPDVALNQQEIEQFNYPLQYVRMGSQQRLVMGLAFDDKGFYKWQSGEQEFLVTRSGRVVQSQGLTSDLTQVSNLQDDPLACLQTMANNQTNTCLLRWQWWANVGEGFAAEKATMTGEFERLGNETVILGNEQQVNTVHWQETVINDSGEERTTWRNHFWLEQRTGRVVKSEQRSHPDWPKTTWLEVKAYKADLTDRGVGSE